MARTRKRHKQQIGEFFPTWLTGGYSKPKKGKSVGKNKMVVHWWKNDEIPY